MTERPATPDDAAAADHPEDVEDGPIGIFPSWRAAYITVLLYTAGLTALLYFLTRLFDYSVG